MKKNGFTLTELIAVFVIIGLVIIVAIPVSNSIMKNNEKERAMLYVETLEKAVTTYCDLYYSGDDSCTVRYNELKSKKLVNDYNYKGVKANIDDDTEFEINGNIEVEFKKDDNCVYTCTKTQCNQCN